MTNAPDQKAEGVAVNLVPGRHDEVSAAPRHDAGAQLRRRRQASLRCEPLADGRRDPLTPSRRDGGLQRGEDLTAWRRALEHLRDLGLLGLPPAHVRRALAERRPAA